MVVNSGEMAYSSGDVRALYQWQQGPTSRESHPGLNGLPFRT